MTQPRLMLNYKQDDTRDEILGNVFPNGVPANDRNLLTEVENHFDFPSGSLSGYRVTREDHTGNILVRPQAVFG